MTEAKRDELARLRKENAELRMRCDVLKRSAAPLGRGCDAALAVAGFIAAQRDQLQIPHAAACRALGVSPAWFYKWRDGDASVRRSRPQLAIEIARIFATHHGSYGSPRITAELREVRCGSRRTP